LTELLGVLPVPCHILLDAAILYAVKDSNFCRFQTLKVLLAFNSVYTYMEPVGFLVYLDEATLMVNGVNTSLKGMPPP
jgi:hypothetical protein